MRNIVVVVIPLGPLLGIMGGLSVVFVVVVCVVDGRGGAIVPERERLLYPLTERLDVPVERLEALVEKLIGD